MNKANIRTILLATAIAVSSSAYAKYSFVSSSRLSSGKWVKMTVKETGIYEISYNELRQLGFADPSKVGVYGKGGRMLPMSFTDRRGTPQMADDLQPVGVFHYDDRLFFYGLGAESVSFSASSESFVRGEMNIYSDTGAYFLSDACEDRLLMEVNPPAGGNPSPVSYGYDYLYHELDLAQNSTDTGQLFWGESFLADEPRYEWNYSIPYADTDADANMECVIYADRDSSGRLGFGVRGASGNSSFSIVAPPSSTFRPQGLSTTRLSLPSKDICVYAEGSGITGDFVNLDYWLLSYRKRIPDFSSADSSTQERLFLDTRSVSDGVEITLPAQKDLAVFNITDPAVPAVVFPEKTGSESKAKFQTQGASTDLVVCDLSRTQLSVSAMEVIGNTDLHALASEGVDLLVITVPTYRQYADRLAALHEHYDGIRTAVVLAEDVYNEFSGGVPDPMAYRALVKMLYESEARQLKNVVFIGTVYGNFRDETARVNEGIIGFQEPVVAADRDAANAMDFYGMTADYISTGSIQDETMHVGVGVIPCYSENDAALYIDKVERYLKKTDYAYLANEFLSVGGVGDAHTHDTQSTLVSDYLNAYLPSPGVTTNLVIDDYGYKEAKAKFLKDLDTGKLFTFYHGHGAAERICEPEFFHNSDIAHLNNPDPGFMYVGGCEFTGTDFLCPGLGELFVTGTSHGIIGMISSTRTTWSGQNFDFSRRLVNSLFHAPGSGNNLREESPTIGEIFAETKTSSPYANELCYLLIGDPALKVYVPLRSISMDSPSAVTPGKGFILSGSVLDADGNTDSSYNGEVVLKFMRPEKTVRSPEYITAGTNEGTVLDVKYMDTRIVQLSGKISNGRFSIRCMVPGDVADFGDGSVAVFAGAFSADKRISASGHATVALAADDTTAGSSDTQKPSASIAFEAAERSLYVTASDNTLLAYDCLTATIDGNKAAAKNTGSNYDISAPTQVFNISCADISDGTHTLAVKCKDISGNELTQSFDFEVTAPSAPLSLEASAKTTFESIAFSSLSHSPALKLVITDSNGITKAALPFADAGATWDCTDSDGNRVAPGLYRAKLTGNETANAHLYSDWVYFEVLD